MRAQGVHDRDHKPRCDQRGADVLPVMTRRFEDHERVRGCAQDVQQGGVADRILGDRDRFQHDAACLINSGDGMPLGRDVYPHEAHCAPFRRGGAGASAPVPTLTLVHARTSQTPRDTVRALSTGRGRHSQRRGRDLSVRTATLSRTPSIRLYSGSMGTRSTNVCARSSGRTIRRTCSVSTRTSTVAPTAGGGRGGISQMPLRERCRCA